MTFDSLSFAAYCSLAILALNVVRGGRSRAWLILGLNVIFITSFVPALVQSLPLVGFLIIGYGAVAVAAKVGNRGLLALLAAIVSLFVWLKGYSFVNFLPRLGFPYIVIGMSYILFRILHLMIDVNQGALVRPDPLTYANYLLFFPNFVSGPIQRFQDFGGQMEQPMRSLRAEEIHASFGRIARGLFMIAVVGHGTLFLLNSYRPPLTKALVAHRAAGQGALLFAAVSAVYIVHLYLNFAGYMDIVIGVGRLCGFVIPENFNRPYAARNLLDLWSRWHMTLTDWFKTYLFNPLLKVLSEAWGTPTRLPYLGVVAFFVSFLVMGMWHGSRNIFVVYGLLQGAGVAINKLYQVEAARRLGKKEYGALCKMGSYRHLMRGICIAFFAVAVSCLWLSEDEASALTSLTGLATALVGFALLAGAIALAGAVIESALQRLPDLIQSTSVAFFMSVLFCLSLSEEHLGEMVQVNRIPFVLAGFALLAGGIALANRAADYVLQKRTAFASRGFATSIHVAPVWMAIRLLVTVYLAMSCGAAPEFVYKGF